MPFFIRRASLKACADHSTATAAGQAQKEFFVNEALARTDMLLHPAVLGEAGAPPSSPTEGDCWLVGASAVGAWVGHEGELACLQSGNWLFASPRNGMAVFDEASGQTRRYVDGWQAATTVSMPSGGLTIDTQARSAVAGLVAALVVSRILPAA